MDYKSDYLSVFNHYYKVWGDYPSIKTWKKGPMNDITSDFAILEFAPNASRDMWTYATCGMSDLKYGNEQLELHLFSPVQSEECIELLTIVAHYHITQKNRLGLWHTVNFGKPWQGSSKCTYGLVSLPYLDGPDLEILDLGGEVIKFYWLIPITESELDFKSKNGIEALEEQFDNGFNYLDINRAGVV